MDVREPLEPPAHLHAAQLAPLHLGDDRSGLVGVLYIGGQLGEGVLHHGSQQLVAQAVGTLWPTLLLDPRKVGHAIQLGAMLVQAAVGAAHGVVTAHRVAV